MSKKNKHKEGYWLALFATFLAFVVVGLGAYTRLVHAGLGCPDWPGCYGFLTVPVSEHAIAVATERFPDAPVDVAKGWAEMVHRYVAGLLMLVVLVLTYRLFKHRHKQGQPGKLPFVILGLIILQAAFGMWTVTLKLWPQVVAAHLLGGFATVSLLFLLTMRLSDSNWKQLPPTWRLLRLRRWARAGLALVIAQIALGGWTSANYAALACPDLPMCQGQWWPETNFEKGFKFDHAIGPNYLGGKLDSAARTAIHLTHRIGAIFVFVVLAGMLLIASSYARGVAIVERQSVRQLSLFILLALILQVLLGISNVHWHLPLFIAVAHNIGGALLLLSMVIFNYRLSDLVDKDVKGPIYE
ncbi:COX15/CtaA family protein [Candidatus Sororendozoicomonas aggregata]|uniref:COX15/CtaA family protein n=1 Tax=Candidatus Sororendozoicomonas aggregata TaxID=3073239 RepID=UPI002ED32F89